MPKGFLNIRYLAAEAAVDQGSIPAIRGAALSGPEPTPQQFDDDEAAARFHAARVLGRDTRSAVRGFSGIGESRHLSDMKLVGFADSPQTSTRLVRFRQTRKKIPVFGSHLVVELGEDRSLVGVSGEVTELGNMPVTPAISSEAARSGIARLAKVSESAVVAAEDPQLMFYHDADAQQWRLVWFLKRVPVAPAEFVAADEGHRGHGMGRSPRDMNPRVNYLVDAQSGEVVFYYSDDPRLAAPLPPEIPAAMKGVDALNSAAEFFGRQVPTGFEMSDPLRRIKTYDLRGGDIEHPAFPATPVTDAAADLQSTNPAAVSAHVHATVVHNFFNDVLQRRGIDGNGMDLKSVVNCTYARDEPPPAWHNAVWYNDTMWYGQDHDGQNGLRSYSRFLDVIAHELTHGVTKHTCDLVYQGESGALNESFSDLFGVIIANWHRVGANSDPDTWNWEMGAGLGRNGGPLRSMSDPTKTGDPDHYSNYKVTNRDSGGVHTNSNIHNKAAWRVLTAKDAAGKRVFTASDVALLYYLTLTRLGNLATFSDTLHTLVDVAKGYWAGFPAKADEHVKAITAAYANTGIT